MKLYELLDTIKRLAATQPNTGDVFCGDVYQLNEKQNVNYPAFVITQDTHYIDKQNEQERYGLILFAVDRLTEDKSNQQMVQDWANETLINVVDNLEQIGINTYTDGQVEVFNQRFDSLCAGAFIRVTFTTDIDDCNQLQLVRSVNGMTGDVILNTEGVTEEELTEKLALKQDVIEDLENIIEGANKGLTSVQPDDLEGKQDTLVSGTNIKTINGNSLLGSGDIEIQSGTNFLGKLGSYTTYLSKFLNALSVKGAVSNFEGISKDAASVGDLFIIEAKAADTHDYYVFLLECEAPQKDSLRGHTIYSYITHDYELLSNKITFIEDTVTDTQYPSAKSVYNFVQPLYEEIDNIVDAQVQQYQTIQNTILPQLNSLSTNKQDTLVSGTNIKTINGESVLGSGNIEIKGGGSTDDCEKLINKVTEITSANTDTQYPSAKAVYDQIKDKKDVFIAQYNVTTYEEITNAVNDGKMVYLDGKTVPNYSQYPYLYPIMSLLGSESSGHISLYFDGGRVHSTFQLFILNYNFDTQATTWSMNSSVFEGQTYRQNVITESYTNYPSSKAVVDYVKGELIPIKDKIDEIELSKFPNATIFGQPIIQQGQISNFSAENYLQFPFIVDFKNAPWQIDMEVRTGADVTGQHNILDSNFGLGFAIQNTKLVMAISHTGTSWDGAYTSELSIEPNKTYRIKMYWNTNTYKVDVSDNNTDWVNYISVANTNSLYPRTMIIGKSIDNRYIWNGSINFNYCSLTISDKVVWQGMDDAGLATRMAVNMNNINDEGKQVVKDIVSTDINSITQRLNNLEKLVKAINKFEHIEVNEDGLFFVDNNMNIGMNIDNNGFHAINLVEYKNIN